MPDTTQIQQTTTEQQTLDFDDKGELQTETIEGVEIFRAGTWTDSRGRKVTITNAHLDEMVNNANRLPHIKPFLKLMHLSPNEHLRVTAKPALGWLEKFRRVGDRLIVDATNVPRKVAQLIRARAYKRISAEILPKFYDEATKQVYGHVVTAAGLLGAVHPAVTTLKDVLSLYGCESFEDNDGSMDGAYTFYESAHQTTEGGESEMDEKKVQEMIDAALKSDRESRTVELCNALGIDSNDDPIKAIAALKADKDRAIADKTAFEQQRHNDEVKSIIDGAVKEGKLAPAHESVIRHMCSGSLDEKVEVEVDGKMQSFTRREWVKSYIEALPVSNKVDKQESGADGEVTFGVNNFDSLHATPYLPSDAERYAKDHGYAIDESSVEMSKRIHAFAAKSGKTFNDAVVSMYNTVLDYDATLGKGGE